jgi:hypothetical protein
MDWTALWQPAVGAILGGIFTALAAELFSRGRQSEGKLPVAIAFAGGAVIGAILALIFLVPKCAPGTTVRITSPTNEESVSRRVQIQGTSQKVCARHEIWTAVIPPDTARVYPQAGVAPVDDTGDWQALAPALLGVEGETKDLGKRFDILALVVDKKGQRALDRYVQESKAKNRWDGMERLPEGVVAQDRVSVKLERLE